MSIEVILTGAEARKKGMKDPRTLRWSAFLNGHWTLERPTQPGRYRIAGLDGKSKGEIVALINKRTGEIRLVPGWEGWFWSFPIPLPPRPVPKPGSAEAARAARSAKTKSRRRHLRLIAGGRMEGQVQGG